jgi:hypothetical protein
MSAFPILSWISCFALELGTAQPVTENDVREGPPPIAVDAAAPEAPAPAASEEPVPEPRARPAEPPAGTPTPTKAPADTKPPTPVEGPKAKLPEFTVGVQAFLRGEVRANPDFNADVAPRDATAILERVRLQAGASWGPLRVLAQAQDARAWGFESGTVSSEGNLDLHQGYFDVVGKSEQRKLEGWIRVGRQEISWGRQRLIGALNWMPTARSFDAVRVFGRWDKLSFDAFAAILGRRETYSVTDATSMPPVTRVIVSDGHQLGAAQLSAAVHKAFNVEAIGLVDVADNPINNQTVKRIIGDVGGHVWGEPAKGLTYDAEAHGQFGEVQGNVQHRAWAWATELAYLYGEKRVKPGVGVGYAMASGHRCTGDSTVAGTACGATRSGEFFNFYPTNHIHYGLIDLRNWSNTRNLEVNARLHFEKIVKALVAYHFFQLQDVGGRWMNAIGQNVGRGWALGNTNHNLGHEIDASVTIDPLPYLMIQPGYAVFVPTGAGTTIGGPHPQHFAYLWMVVTI